MLQAIVFNKAGRNITSDEIHWKELFKASEDSLTSTIFGLLSYLPQEMFWKIFLKSCYSNPIVMNNTRIIDYSFWPKWNSNNTKNSNLVEPDLFISTSEFDIIIEAKRYDHNQQSKEQWKAEFIAYLNEYGDLEKKVYLIAVGGIYDEKVEKLPINEGVYINKEIEIIKCRWSRILRLVKDEHAIIAKDKSHSISSIYNILGDIILGFRIHGYYTGEWFEQTKFEDLLNINLNYKLSENQIKYPKFRWKTLLKFDSIDTNNYNLLLNNERTYKGRI